MNRLFLAPIVEGHGEVEAVPALLHRIAAAVGHQGALLVNAPIRVKSGSFIHDDGYFRKHVMLAAAKAANRQGAVIILLDCDDNRNCPATLGPGLLSRARRVRDDIPILIALAWREYETWLLTAVRSLAGRHGLPNDIQPPIDPERIRGAKEWLGDRMPNRYDPITHQAVFTRLFDLDQARANASFARLYDRIGGLLDARVQSPGGAPDV